MGLWGGILKARDGVTFAMIVFKLVNRVINSFDLIIWTKSDLFETISQ